MGQWWSCVAAPKMTHVIFDLDGTLIDSEEQYYQLQKECLAEFGKEFDVDQKRALLGLTTDEEISKLIQMYDLKNITHDEYLKLYESKYERYLSKCPPLPGASALIKHFHKNNIPMAICTNSNDFQCNIKVDRLYGHWRSMIHNWVVAASDHEVKHPKPHPDPYLVTMKRFHTRPQSAKHCLVFEDSITGATAAIKAGATVILIPQRHFLTDEAHKQIEHLRPHLAAVLDSLTEFNPSDYGLPGFDDENKH